MENQDKLPPTMAERTTRNSLYSMGVNAWYLLSRFLLTPFILHYLSLEEYGLWSLCFVVMSFLALSSMGLETTYIKYVAQFHATGEINRRNRLLSTGLIITTGFAISVLILIWITMPYLISFLGIERALAPTASFIFIGTGFIFMLDITLNCFARALDGYQYLALTSKIRFWSSCVELALIVPLLFLGYGIFGLMTSFFIRYLIVIAINMLYAYKLIPGLKIRLHYFDKPSLQLLLSYGGKMQILSIVGIVLSTLDRIIITSFLGLAATGLYEIGRKIPNKGARIPTEISGAIMPALSHLQGNNDMAAARSLFITGSRYMAMLSAPLFTFFAATAPYAIWVWLGPGYDGAAPVMVIISLSTIVHLFTGVSSALARGFDKLEWELKYSTLNLILCFLLTPLLASRYGLTGAATGVALSTVISSVYFLSMTHSYFKLALKKYCKLVLYPVFYSCISASCIYLLLQIITDYNLNRITMLFILMLAGIAHITIIFILLASTGTIIPSEKIWLKKHIVDRLRSTGQSKTLTPGRQS